MYELTVVIPTYNRKEDITNTLKSLEKQTCQDFKVYITDNNSDFDINSILEEVNPDFAKRINIEKNRVNFGADYNIQKAVLSCDTKWGWLLSDDDIISEDSIRVIINDIRKHPDAAWIHYSVYKFDDNNKTRLFRNLNSFAKFLNGVNQVWEIVTGDLIFSSNKVFNYDIMNKYLPLYIQYGGGDTYVYVCCIG